MPYKKFFLVCYLVQSFTLIGSEPRKRFFHHHHVKSTDGYENELERLYNANDKLHTEDQDDNILRELEHEIRVEERELRHNKLYLRYRFNHLRDSSHHLRQHRIKERRRDPVVDGGGTPTDCRYEIETYYKVFVYLGQEYKQKMTRLVQTCTIV
uniref:Uncharacterized protein n=1 Tax=Clytia hemisphaerica TaxID=252671 RepID=A0A7M5UNH5_9CNID